MVFEASRDPSAMFVSSLREFRVIIIWHEKERISKSTHSFMPAILFVSSYIPVGPANVEPDWVGGSGPDFDPPGCLLSPGNWAGIIRSYKSSETGRCVIYQLDQACIRTLNR